METFENEVRAQECSEIREVVTKTKERALVDLERARVDTSSIQRLKVIEDYLRDSLAGAAAGGFADSEKVERLIGDSRKLLEFVESESAKIKERVSILLERVAVIESIEKYLYERGEGHETRKI